MIARRGPGSAPGGPNRAAVQALTCLQPKLRHPLRAAQPPVVRRCAAQGVGWRPHSADGAALGPASPAAGCTASRRPCTRPLPPALPPHPAEPNNGHHMFRVQNTVSVRDKDVRVKITDLAREERGAC